MPKIAPFEKYVEQYEAWFVKNRWVYEAELRAVKAVLPTEGLGVEIGGGHRAICGTTGDQNRYGTFKTHEGNCPTTRNSSHKWRG